MSRGWTFSPLKSLITIFKMFWWLYSWRGQMSHHVIMFSHEQCLFQTHWVTVALFLLPHITQFEMQKYGETPKHHLVVTTGLRYKFHSEDKPTPYLFSKKNPFIFNSIIFLVNIYWKKTKTFNLNQTCLYSDRLSDEEMLDWGIWNICYRFIAIKYREFSRTPGHC